MFNDLDGELYICKALHSVKDRKSQLVQALLPEKPHDTDNLLETLEIIVVAKVMFTMLI